MLLIMLVVLNRDYREIVALLCEKRDRRSIRNKSRTKSIRLNRALMRQLEYDSKENFSFFLFGGGTFLSNDRPFDLARDF